jgi:hypothetical protein
MSHGTFFKESVEKKVRRRIYKSKTPLRRSSNLRKGRFYREVDNLRKRGSKNTLPASVVKGFENEQRFLDLFKPNGAFDNLKPFLDVPFYFGHIQKASTEEDKFQSVDFWLFFYPNNSIKFPIQIKSSFHGMMNHKYKNPERNFIYVIVNKYRSNREILKNFFRSIRRFEESFCFVELAKAG